MPRSGGLPGWDQAARPEIAPDARMLIVGDYVVLYRVHDEDIAIVRVVHGARKLEDLFRYRTR